MKTDNELIAEFDGWSHRPTPKGQGQGLWNRISHGQAAWSSSAFRYHKSWDWLMPVVEKIEKYFSWIASHLPNPHYHQVTIFEIEYSDYPKKETSARISICIELNGMASKFHTIQFKSTSKIEATYNACVEFIKWYNSNKSLTHE